MKKNINTLAANSIICAVYVLLTLVNPLGYGAVQFRYSEIIAVLPFFNRRYIPGVVLGVLLANLFSPLGIIDVFVGVLICAISYSISYYIKNKYVNALIYSILCAVFVPLELYYVVKAPIIITSLGIFAGQIVVTILGVIIFDLLYKRTNFSNIY